MAEVNPELAKLVVEVLKSLHITVAPAATGSVSSELADEKRVNARIDAYGAAFKRLYAHVAGAEASPELKDYMGKMRGITSS